MIKKIKILLAVVIACILLSSCTLFEDRLFSYFGFDKNDFNIVMEEDTFGFFGDGHYTLILDCTNNADKARTLTNEWKPLPLSQNLQLIMYGGESDGVTYLDNFAEEAHMPEVKNGVYKFVDRHDDAKDKSDDTDLLKDERGSINFSLAVYDYDSEMLYFYETNS